MQIAATPRRRAATSRRFVAVVSTGTAVQQRRFASWVAVVVAEERFLAGPVGVAWRRGGKWGGLVPRLRSSSNEPIGDQLLTSLVVLDILPLQISDETGIKLQSIASVAQSSAPRQERASLPSCLHRRRRPAQRFPARNITHLPAGRHELRDVKELALEAVAVAPDGVRPLTLITVLARLLEHLQPAHDGAQPISTPRAPRAPSCSGWARVGAASQVQQARRWCKVRRAEDRIFKLLCGESGIRESAVFHRSR